jgi:hypothetical protein
MAVSELLVSALVVVLDECVSDRKCKSLEGFVDDVSMPSRGSKQKGSDCDCNACVDALMPRGSRDQSRTCLHVKSHVNVRSSAAQRN